MPARSSRSPRASSFSGRRCIRTRASCSRLCQAASDGHLVRCHLYNQKEGEGRRAEQTLPGAPRVHAESDIGDSAQCGAALLRVRDLKVHFPIRKGLLKRTVGQVKAVDGMSFDIASGRTLALVGESGCGKTTAGKAILQLIRPSAGSVQFEGHELTRLRGAALRERRADFQLIFQDPYASLNPRMRVADILAEGMKALA